MRNRAISKLAVIVAIVFFSLLAGSSVYADEPPKLGIRPVDIEGSYFSLTMSPGESRELAVELGNYGSSRVKARTYAADAYTLVNGGFGSRLDGEPTSGATNWVDYAAETIELDPGMGIRRTFSVSVPADAGPGEYLTSLAIQNADPMSTGGNGSFVINQVVRQVIAISITVPGERVAGLQIGEAAHRTVAGKSSVSIAVKNTGNVRLKPAGEFVLNQADGAEVSRYPVAMDSLYAGHDTVVEVPFARRLNPGQYAVWLTLADPENGVQVSVGPIALKVVEEEKEPPPRTASTPPQPAPVNQDILDPSSAWWKTWALLAGASAVALVSSGTGYAMWRRRRRSSRAVRRGIWE